MEKFRDYMMHIAEVLDAWRIIPRTMAAAYGYMVYKLFLWYTSIPTSEKVECDNAVLNTLINNGIDIQQAMNMVCTVVDTVGGPTSQQTSFVTVIIGLSTGIFGFYVNSGKDKGDSGMWVLGNKQKNKSPEPINPTNQNPPS